MSGCVRVGPRRSAASPAWSGLREWRLAEVLMTSPDADFSMTLSPSTVSVCGMVLLVLYCSSVRGETEGSVRATGRVWRRGANARGGETSGQRRRRSGRRTEVSGTRRDIPLYALTSLPRERKGTGGEEGEHSGCRHRAFRAIALRHRTSTPCTCLSQRSGRSRVASLYALDRQQRLSREARRAVSNFCHDRCSRCI